MSLRLTNGFQVESPSEMAAKSTSISAIAAPTRPVSAEETSSRRPEAAGVSSGMIGDSTGSFFGLGFSPSLSADSSSAPSRWSWLPRSMPSNGSFSCVLNAPSFTGV